MRSPRARARASLLGGAAVAATMLAACAPGLPASVVEGSTVRVGWSESLTSLNAATTEGSSAGNREVAQATHDAFARLEGGDVVADDSFGRVEVLDPDPASFTVRYDLADRTWSDGIPIDAADLLLAWAAGSGATEGDFDSVPSDLAQSTEVPTRDDFGRRIDVAFSAPVRGWHTALDVAVPAHVVGSRALGIDDPMEAKQAVIDAITEGDNADLEAIAQVWSTGFDVDGDGDLPGDLTVASGPYEVTAVGSSGPAGDRVRLEVNRSYDGGTPPAYERLELLADAPLLDRFPDDLDVVQLRPTRKNFQSVRYLERRDHHLSTTDDGRLWTLALRADRGVFRDVKARRAFLRAAPSADLRSAGAGPWSDAFGASQSLLFAPGSGGYDVALEDAGFRDTFEASTSEPEVDRAEAGVAAGTPVCVLHDTDEPFAKRAVRALKKVTAEAGWAVTGCRTSNLEATLAGGEGAGDWQAVLTTVPLPDSPDDITEVWGGTEPSPVTGSKSENRARLVAQLAATADPYDARDLQVRIEAGLIRRATALPLTMDPVVTLSSRGMNAVLPESGRAATLLAGAGAFEPAS